MDQLQQMMLNKNPKFNKNPNPLKFQKHLYFK